MSHRFLRLGVIAIGLLAVAGQALAHAHLQTATPLEKATLVAASALVLTFSEALDLKFSGVKLMGPQRTSAESGIAALVDRKMGLGVPISGKLGAGSYVVDWHVLSVDGHKTIGSYSFAVKP